MRAYCVGVSAALMHSVVSPRVICLFPYVAYFVCGECTNCNQSDIWFFFFFLFCSCSLSFSAENFVRILRPSGQHRIAYHAHINISTVNCCFHSVGHGRFSLPLLSLVSVVVEMREKWIQRPSRTHFRMQCTRTSADWPSFITIYCLVFLNVWKENQLAFYAFFQFVCALWPRCFFANAAFVNFGIVAAVVGQLRCTEFVGQTASTAVACNWILATAIAARSRTVSIAKVEALVR